MQELSAEQAQKQSLLLPISQVSFQQLFLPLYSVLDLWRVGCHQMRTCTGMGQIVAQRAACTQAAITKINNAGPGPRKRPKSMIARQSWTPIAIP